jgi:hypothetical protein
MVQDRERKVLQLLRPDAGRQLMGFPHEASAGMWSKGRAVLNLVLATCALMCCPSAGIAEQIQVGTVRGIVTDSFGAPLPEARLFLENSINGFHRTATAASQGEFVFDNVPFDSYRLRAVAGGFLPGVYSASVRSNIPVVIDIRLSVAGANESVTVEPREQLVEAESSSTETDIHSEFIQRLPGAAGTGKLQRLIATTPGWAVENGGLLHIRGVDDGILYVVDGVPTSDRVDSVMAGPFDTEAIRSVNVLTGNIPAEFGGRSGAVVTIQPKSGIDLPTTGGLDFGAGAFGVRQITATASGGIKRKFGYFVSGAAGRSDRFLDPVDFRNFHNSGGLVQLSARIDWHPGAGDLILSTISINATDLQEPNDLQQELAGQRQRQQLRNDDQSIMWQHTWSQATVSNIAYFRRFYHSTLTGSAFDTPLFTGQDRKHARQGIIANVTSFYRGHTFKAGGQAERVTPREFFEFAVTDPVAAEQAGIAVPALQFGPSNPFAFRDRKVRGLVSWFAQDTFSPVKNLTVNAGVRYDHSSLLVSDQQFSPRVGAVYYVPATKTAFRGSFNRLYMPPQIENLLLANSDQARTLSPFATGVNGGGSRVLPERVTAYEAGFAQDVAGVFRLDAACWWRRFTNIDDPNVLFNTTIIFPNSVARAIAHGVDVRLDLKERAGWSGYLSYGNSTTVEIAPINGGLFLTDDFGEIGVGTRFIPDHDQRNQGAAGITYYNRGSGAWGSFSGSYQSGVPLGAGGEPLTGLQGQPGADLIDVKRGRVKPRMIFNVSAGMDLLRDEKITVSAQLDVQNVANERFVYNLDNPFSGTHFGYPREFSGRIRFTFR